MIHIINGLGVISGAEGALLRVASAQSTRPLLVISLAKASGDEAAMLPKDVQFVALGGVLGLVGAGIRLALVLRRLPSDTVVSWMYRSNGVAALASLVCMGRHRLIWNIRHSLARIDRESWRVRTSVLINRILCRVPHRIVYASERALLEHEEYGLPKTKSLYIPNGFITQAPKQRLSSNSIVFGHAGRMAWEKGVDTLLTAFARFKQRSGSSVQLMMAGPGYEHDNPPFNALLNDSGSPVGSIRALGRVGDMAEFYAKIDVLILSSVSEGFPNVLAEALLAGVPCITTDVGDARLIVSESCGWVVPPGDAEALALAMLRAAATPRTILAQMGAAGSQEVGKKYAIDAIARRYDELALP